MAADRHGGPMGATGFAGTRDAGSAAGASDADYASMTLPETLLGDEELVAGPEPAAGEKLYVDERALADTAAALRQIGTDAGDGLAAYCAEVERIIAGTPLPFMHEHMLGYVGLMRRRYDAAVTRIEYAATSLETFSARTHRLSATGARLLAEPAASAADRPERPRDAERPQREEV